VQGAASKLRVTPYTFLLTAFYVLLHRHTGCLDLIIGTSEAGRNDPRWAETMGMIVRVLPIRGDLSGTPMFSELVRRIRLMCSAPTLIDLADFDLYLPEGMTARFRLVMPVYRPTL
jgi:non-ribosomal peptide synthetase component F